MKRHRKALKLESAINITNLLDVAFVLLICFMMVAPTLKHGLKLELPEVAGGAIQTKKNFTIVIKNRTSIEEEPRIYLEDKIVTIEEIKEKLHSQYLKSPDIDVLIECERSVPYDVFAQVLGAVKNAGVTNIGIVTEPSKKS